MNFETYVAGIGPNGLKDIYEIKILVCYLLQKVKQPLSSEELNELFQNCGNIVDYFSLATTLAQLKKTGHIIEEETEDGVILKLLELGEETSNQLNSILPTALKDKVVRAALNIIAARKLERARDVQIRKVDDGFVVDCAIHDIGTDLLKMEIFAPDKISAEQIKDYFLNDTGNVYKGIIGILTNNTKAVTEVISECET